MIITKDINKKIEKERSCVITLHLKGSQKFDVEDSLEELAQLVIAAGGNVQKKMIVTRLKPTPNYYIGKGKVEELLQIIFDEKIGMVVFNNDLTPAQERNLSEMLKVKVLDRTELILDIFAQRAKSNEGKLQIELAQLAYMLPRLTRLWTHLSRQVGGIGTRGPGEKQLEVDRRRVRERIVRLNKELDKIKSNRDIQRQSRIRKGFPLISFIGYTNAGKSTLFNSLTSAHAFVKNQLFSTLTPLSRQIKLPNNQRAIVSDTVGFLKKLPHHLIESFKATLEEVVVADLLIHVIDITIPDLSQKYIAVMDVLKELGVIKKPMIVVFNKIDLLKNNYILERALREYSGSVGVSAKTGVCVDKLLDEVVSLIGRKREFCRFMIPHEKAKEVRSIFHSGSICEKKYKPEGIYVSAEVPLEIKNILREYLV